MRPVPFLSRTGAALALASLLGCVDEGNGVPFGLSERVAIDDSVAFSADTTRPGELVSTVNAFPYLTFEAPVDFARIPQTNYNVVVEHRGQIRVFENSPLVDDAEMFLDITGRVNKSGAEAGLIRMAFDPDYPANGRAYVTYSGKANLDPRRCEKVCSFVSRFTRSPRNPLRLDPDSEEILLVLEQPEGTHNIGNLMFGPDGYLYIGAGDGGFSKPPRIDAQDRSNLFGTVMRIDVSGPAGYIIPPDNPFVGAGLEVAGVIGAGRPVREEIWAYGLRNPHRFSIDPVTGRLWLGDVGQGVREEINEIVPGGNYGWPAFEGTINQNRTDIGRRNSDYIFPVLEYGHNEGLSITGGFVYRGSLLPQLAGQYIFGDFAVGTIWSIDPESVLRPPPKTVVTQSAGGYGVAGFSEVDGEIYVVSIGAGIIQKLVDARSDERAKAPNLLSESGLFSNLPNLTPNEGLIPYAVNSPLWSDGTAKQRWFALPDASQIQFDPELPWTFPLGTILVKHFEIDLDETDASNPLTRLETRVLVNTRTGWNGYSYRWNEAQTDAERVPGRQRIRLERKTIAGVVTQDYTLPGSGDCNLCHNATVGHVLGLRTSQIDRDYDYPNATDNQLRTLDHLDIFEPRPDLNAGYAHRASPEDATASLDLRARSYLATNCSHCHNANNTQTTDIDLSDGIPIEQTHTLGAVPLAGDMDVTDARIIAPGERNRSTLWLRMGVRGPDSGQMPRFATHVVDQTAVALIGEWIDSLPAAP